MSFRFSASSSASFPKTAVSLLIALVVFFVGFLSSCTAKKAPEPSVSRTSFLLDTEVTITLYGTKDDSLITECFSLCREYEKKFSRTLESSEISRLNCREADTVSDETYDLLKTGLSYSELTDGAFDLTIGSCSSLWDFTSGTPLLPDKEKVTEAASHVGYQKLSLENGTVTFSDDGTKIDAGAIAKGYIADRIKDFLLKNQAESALIDLGGNILCIGSKPDGSDFKIGIQKPFDERGASLLTVSLSDYSMVTSGIYERYFEQEGVLYHHILNPATGYPCENDLLSVTILSRNSVDGDALSTACFSLGKEKGLELINRLPEVYGVFVTDDYKIHYSEGLLETFTVEELS